MAIDLHTHTVYSDGTLTPEELVKLAKDENLTSIAITDHDTTAGLEDAIYWGIKYGVQIVPGIELSIDCALPHNGHMHLVGLFIDYKNDYLNQTLEFLRRERDTRNRKIIKILGEKDMPISLQELRNEAGEGSIGRPHIARVLFKKGYVSSVQVAFEKLLQKGAPAYVEKVKLDRQKGIQLIKQSGGISILAHPGLLGYDTQEEITGEVLQLKELGLEGIEVYSSLQNQELITWLKDFAQEQGLLISGGSDFHGENKNGVRLGSGRGNLHIPDEIYKRLVTYHNSKSSRK